MEAQILNFRRGNRTQNTKQAIIQVASISTNDKAKSLVNKKVVWTSSSGKEIKGTITQVHGNIGKLRVQFEKGIPGQALGAKVKVE
jgi:large subunit ribosomal protein L35Ae